VTVDLGCGDVLDGAHRRLLPLTDAARYGHGVAWTDETRRTERLLLRAYTESDRPTVTTLLTDPVVREFLGGPIELPDDFEQHPMGQQWGIWAVEVVASRECIGSCWVGRSRGQLELAYTFVQPAWGHGYAFEAASAVIDWAWTTQVDPDLIAVTQVANVRSRSLLARLGFTEEERFEEYDAEQGLHRLARPPEHRGDQLTTPPRTVR
jgi:RimJ/RimL family protein N-acetyltransferase